MNTLRIGMIGLDTSHAPAFAQLLHDSSAEHHVAGARITAAFPGGSPDIALSANRVAGFTATLRDEHQVEMVDSVAGLRDKCDAVMIEAIDGRAHWPLFREVAEWGVPVFIDKPLALSGQDAQAITSLAEVKKVRVTSASAIRFAQSFQEALAQREGGDVLGGDFFGPMEFAENCGDYLWYGIHAAEMLFATFGPGCQEVQALRQGPHDIILGRWTDGRLGVLRGNRAGNYQFGGTIHRQSTSVSFDVASGTKPFYASLLERVVPFFRGEGEVVPPTEMVEVIAFLDAANRSADSGGWIDVQ